VGAKGDLLGGRLAFDTAVYYLKWEDIQQSIGIPLGGTFITAGLNSESASGPGFEFATTAEVVDGLTLGVNFGWNDLTLDAAVVSQSSSGPVTLFSKGSRLNFSPQYTVGGSAEYKFPLGGAGYEGRFSASANYTSELLRTTLVGSTVTVLSSDTLLFGNASFAIDAPDDRWSATLYADNVTDEQGGYLNGAAGTSNNLRPRPRTIGVQFDFHY
jgi:iron complex outermembrane recepter protein